MLEVHRETRRHVQFLAAAKSMDRKVIGFFARLMDSSASVDLLQSCLALRPFV